MRKSLFSAIGIAVAVIAYATPSSAQTVTGNTTSGSLSLPIQFAREALGSPGSNPELTIPSTTINVDYGTADIASGRTANFTFALSGGATFATAPTGLVLMEGGADSTAKISQNFVSGGSAGSSSVTYRVRTTAALAAASTTFLFTVPKLSNAASILRVPDSSSGVRPTITVRVTITPSADDALQADRFAKFPADGAAATTGVVAIARGHNIVNLTLVPSAGTTSTAPVIQIRDRTMLNTAVTTTVVSLDSFPSGATTRNAIIIGSVRGGRTNPVVTPDASTQIQAMDPDRFVVTVTGNFQTGDILMFSPVLTGYQASRTLSISGNTATTEVSLNDIDSGALRNFYYVPAPGVVAQKVFRFMFALNWASSTIMDSTVSGGVSRVQYAGLNTMAHAYAIPNPNNADQGNLRIRCQESVGSTCVVFFECLSQEGVRIGDGTLPEVSIPGQQLRTYQSKSSLREVLGVREWSGRLSCNIMSEQDVAVQLLVRSGSVGTLTNNTYISGVEQNPTYTE